MFLKPFNRYIISWQHVSIKAQLTLRAFFGGHGINAKIGYFSQAYPHGCGAKTLFFPKMRYNSPREKDEQFGLWKREGMGCFPCPLFCSCHNKSIMEIVVQEARTKSIQSFKKIKLSNIWLASSSCHERLKSVLCNQFNALLQSRFYCVLTTCQKWVFGLDISGYVLSEN